MKTYINTTLTKRENEVLLNISYGHSANEIGKILMLSSHTIISYRRNLLRKLGAKNGAGLVRKAIELGLLRIHLSQSAISA